MTSSLQDILIIDIRAFLQKVKRTLKELNDEIAAKYCPQCFRVGTLNYSVIAEKVRAVCSKCHYSININSEDLM